MSLLNYRELKDNLGSDDPEGDIPVLLQAVLARNPNVFREKSMQNRYGVQSGESSYSFFLTSKKDSTISYSAFSFTINF